MRLLLRRLRIVSSLCYLGLIFAASAAFAGTYTIPAGSGTLSFTETTTTSQCFAIQNGRTIYYTVYDYQYTGFSYTVSGTITPLTGGDSVIYSTGSSNPASNCENVDYAVWLTSSLVDVQFLPPQVIVGGKATGQVTAFAYPGWINPKYQILGVMYSPPGAKSTVTYGDNDVVGSSTGFSASFNSTVSKSISLSTTVGVFGFTNKITTTNSSSYSQEEDSSNSVAVTQTVSSSTGLSGYADPVTGLNHDYDYIFVWLNPLQLYTAYTDTSGNQTSISWNGFGYDLNDTPAYPDMDEIGIQLGCLNGNFYQQYVNGSNTNWLTCETVFNTNFARSWALQNTDASSSALTPTLAKSSPPYNFCTQTGTDLYNLCQADPFGANPNYVPAFNGGTTTTDGRFTACGNSHCNSTIEYEPNVNKTYSQGYSTTVTSSETAKYTYANSFSIEQQFGWTSGKCPTGNSDFCVDLGTDTKFTTTWTTSDQFSQSTNNSSGSTGSFSIVGPAEGYTGCDSFVVYQDNLYGTFMFYCANP